MFKHTQKQTCMFEETRDPIVWQKKRNAYEKNIPLCCAFLIVMHACYVGVYTHSSWLLKTDLSNRWHIWLTHKGLFFSVEELARVAVNYSYIGIKLLSKCECKSNSNVLCEFESSCGCGICTCVINGRKDKCKSNSAGVSQMWIGPPVIAWVRIKFHNVYYYY